MPANSGRQPGTPVELVSAGPPLEIVELHPVPRVELLVLFRLRAEADAATVALATARFLSAVVAADRKLKLAVDPKRSKVVGDEVTLVLVPAPLGSRTAGWLEAVAAVAREAVADFEGATLTRAEVVPAG